MPWPWSDGYSTLNQAGFRDVDVIAVGQEPCPLFPGYQTGGTVDLADVRTLAGLSALTVQRVFCAQCQSSKPPVPLTQMEIPSQCVGRVPTMCLSSGPFVWDSVGSFINVFWELFHSEACVSISFFSVAG